MLCIRKRKTEHRAEEKWSFKNPWGYPKVLRNYPDNVCHRNCCWDYPSYHMSKPFYSLHFEEGFTRNFSRIRLDICAAGRCSTSVFISHFALLVRFHLITSLSSIWRFETMFHSVDYFNTIARHTNNAYHTQNYLKRNSEHVKCWQKRL